MPQPSVASTAVTASKARENLEEVSRGLKTLLLSNIEPNPNRQAKLFSAASERLKKRGIYVSRTATGLFVRIDPYEGCTGYESQRIDEVRTALSRITQAPSRLVLTDVSLLLSSRTHLVFPAGTACIDGGTIEFTPSLHTTYLFRHRASGDWAHVRPHIELTGQPFDIGGTCRSSLNFSVTPSLNMGYTSSSAYALEQMKKIQESLYNLWNSIETTKEASRLCAAGNFPKGSGLYDRTLATAVGRLQQEWEDMGWDCEPRYAELNPKTLYVEPLAAEDMGDVTYGGPAPDHASHHKEPEGAPKDPAEMEEAITVDSHFVDPPGQPSQQGRSS